MRNLKRALSLALSSVMLLGMMVVGTSAASYPDVDAQDNLEAIEVLEMLGVMSGDEKGNFNPDAKVTRNEMAVIMTHLLNLNAGGTSPFTDVPTWAQPYVAACYANGVTAGTSATTYGGSSNVTATEAALMVMKALGYFGYQGEFGDNWSLAVVKQASKIGLFDGISAAVSDQLTRSEAAQLCLNALEADVVVVEEHGGLAVEGNGMTVTEKPTYSYSKVERTADYRTTDGDKIQQLCEKLYGEKLSNDNSGSKYDEFGRPASVWTYAGEKVTAPKAADATYTAAVSYKTIYSDLGLTTASQEATVVTNDKANTADKNITLTKSATTELGANGDLIQVYKTLANNGTVASVRIVVTMTYAGEVTAVTTNSDDERVVKVDGKEYKTEAFAKDDVVLYTLVDNEIKSMSLANLAVSGEITRKITTSGKESLTIGGTAYSQSSTAGSSIADAKVKDEINLYVDAYGYAIYATEVKAAEAQYAIVLGVKTDGFTGDKTNYAKIVLADGTQAEVEYKQSTTDKGVDITGRDGAQYLVSYTVKDNVYTFSNAKEVNSESITIEKGNATLKTGLYADSKTVFIVRSGDKDSYTYTAYTGIKNVPSIDGAKATVLQDGNTAKLVFVTAGSESTSDGSYIFVTTRGAAAGNDGDAFYTVNAVVDGKITTIDAVGDAIATVKGDKDGLLKSAVYNKDGQLTKASDETDSKKYVAGKGIGEFKNDTIALKGVKYSYADGVVVFEVNKDGKITESTLEAVAEDSNDNFVATLKDGAITALYVTENT